MSLLEDAKALARKPGTPCGVATAISQLTPERLADLDEAMWARDTPDRFTVSAASLADALKAWDVRLSAQIIARHRGQRCTCPS